MSKFSKNNFYMVIHEIEEMEKQYQNIWVPIGILEIMYNDDKGWLDFWFHKEPSLRNIEWLWNKLNIAD